MSDSANLEDEDDILELVVSEEDEGRRLDQVMADHFEISRSQLEKHLARGAVTVDGAPPVRGKRTPVTVGAHICYRPPPPEPLELLPEEMDLSILFEDEHILALDKPAHVVVHPGEGHARGTLLAGVLHHLGKLPDTDVVRPGVVHRLDKGTTGVIVFAKSLDAHHGLVEAFKGREVQKTYLAITQGVPKPREGSFDTFYGRHPAHRQRFSSRVQTGKRALTHYEVLEAYPGAASVQVALETGRTHQIRVHFADNGHPLVGDVTYARRKVVRDPESQKACDVLDRPALHAWELEMAHPITGEPLHLTAPMPPDLVELVEKLRKVAELRKRV